MRVRPSRSSRPRTRQRPKHSDAVEGFVVAVDRGRYTCHVGTATVTAMRARELGRHGVVVGDHVQIVGGVSAVGKGRHTSSSALALRMPDGLGWIIDTPGIRSFGLAHVSADSVLHGFPDLVEASTRCPPNCDHTGTSGDCGLDKLVAEGGADARRLASFRRLLASKEGAVTEDEGPA